VATLSPKYEHEKQYQEMKVFSDTVGLFFEKGISQRSLKTDNCSINYKKGGLAPPFLCAEVWGKWAVSPPAAEN